MGTLYVVLHCQSCYNKSGIFTGRADVDLTDSGHEHAEEIAKQLKDVEIHKAYSSSLKRTLQTLDHILKYHSKTKLILDDRIIERDYGELTHQIKKEYKQKHPDTYDVYHRSYDVSPPGGESIEAVEKRVLPFIHEVIKEIQETDKNVLIVTHSNAVRPMRRFLENLSIEEMMELENNRDVILEYPIS